MVVDANELPRDADVPVDPEDFLRALLKISPEDAETARSSATRLSERKKTDAPSPPEQP